MLEKIAKFHTKWNTQKRDITTHCRRELMHAVLKFLLSDPEFLHAYKYGIVVECADGIKRRVYPRFFTYSADYPEKYVLSWCMSIILIWNRVLLATIRDGGLCPCPRCLTLKSKLHLMGQVPDLTYRSVQGVRKYLHNAVKLVRSWIYTDGYGIGSSAVDAQLKETSSVPTMVSPRASFDCVLLGIF